MVRHTRGTPVGDGIRRRVLRSLIGVPVVLALVAAPGIAYAGGAATGTVAAAAPAVTRLGGADRYQTAVAVSQNGYPSGAPVVYLAAGTDYPDALSAGPAAAHAGGPLLLTPPEQIPSDVVDELKRLKPGRIVLIGGERAISAAAARVVAGVAPVTRIAGADRFDTSRKIAATYGAAASAFLATGTSFPDAVAASAAAGHRDVPVILVNPASPVVDQPTVDLLGAIGASDVVIVGGPAAVSQGVETSLVDRGFATQRLYGSDRYETAVAINRAMFPSASRVFLANGTQFADALAGAALAGVVGSPLYLAQAQCVQPSTATDVTQRLGATAVTLLGGSTVISDGVGRLLDCATWAAQEKARSEAALLNALNSTLASLPGSYSVTVRELAGLKRSVAIRGAEMKEPASSIKLFAAYVTLKLVDAGMFSLDSRTSSGTSLRDCLRVMIHISDNACHVELIALIGQQNLNDLFYREGYTGTHYVGWAGGVRYSSKHSTADDLTLLLSRLDAGTLLSPASTTHLLDLMKSQIWRTRVASGIPPSVVQASKIGSLWVSSGMVDTDAALVYAHRGTYAISVLGSHGASPASIARISRVVYENLDGAFGPAASYPVEQMYTTNTVTLFSRPGSGAIRTIPPGTVLEAIDSVRIWYRVKVGGTTGYVNSYFLANR